MIVGTAGHIDHGKTALVRALTGIDADRLPEEKSRGLTIDLGFAYTTLPGGPRVGFVDVPGHEKLIRNMLAGAIGFDYVILVVAADDGIMPQTREHLSILDLIGIERGLVALTKADRVEPERLDAVRAEIAALLAPTSLGGFEIVPCSSVTGLGIDTVRARLVAAGEAPVTGRDGGLFRLAVDRSFTVAGSGTVVTGTVYAGHVKPGDTLVVSPSGKEVRVRGLRAQDAQAASGGPGMRCALNLAGGKFTKAGVGRGDWVVAEALHAPTNRLGVRLKLLGSEPRPLEHWTPVHVHIGASDVTGRVSLLDAKAIQPGADDFAMLVLDRAVGALKGDRFIVRDQSAWRTIGGGEVLDPFQPRRGIKRPERLRRLEMFERDAPHRALAGLMKANPRGVDLSQFATAWNLGPDAAREVETQAEAVCITVVGKRLGFSAPEWTKHGATVLEGLAAYHRAVPDSPGPTVDELVGKLPEKPLLAIYREAIQHLIADGAIARRGTLVYLPGHEATLTGADQLLWEDVRAILGQAGVAQPRVNDLAAQLGLEGDELRPLLDKLWRIGALYKISNGYFLPPDVVRELARIAEDTAAEQDDGLLTVGTYREAAGLTRHITVPVLEFFDKVGFTRRVKKGRRIRLDSTEIFGDDMAEPVGRT